MVLPTLVPTSGAIFEIGAAICTGVCIADGTACVALVPQAKAPIRTTMIGKASSRDSLSYSCTRDCIFAQPNLPNHRCAPTITLAVVVPDVMAAQV